MKTPVNLSEYESKRYCDIGARLKVFRLLKGLSQEKAATHIGITFQQMQKYEHGTNKISITKIEQLAEFYDIHPAVILGDKYIGVGASMPDFTATELKVITCLRRMREREEKATKELIFNLGKQDGQS